MTEHEHSYTITIMDLDRQEMKDVVLSHCILCGEEREEEE